VTVDSAIFRLDAVAPGRAAPRVTKAAPTSSNEILRIRAPFGVNDSAV